MIALFHWTLDLGTSSKVALRQNILGSLGICVEVLEFSGLIASKGALAFVPSKALRKGR
jgi:hypothetical protein